MVTIENYEEYLMLDADGELDDTGKAALEAFLSKNPSLRQEQAAWHSLKLRPDQEMVYPGKDALLKQPRHVPLVYRPYLLAAAAAIAGMLIIIPALHRNTHYQSLASRFSHQFPVRTLAADTMTPILATLPAPKTTVPVVQQRVNRGVRAGMNLTSFHEPSEPVAALDIKNIELMNDTHQEPQHPVLQPVTDASVDAVIREQHESGFPKIMLAEANKPALNLFKRAFEERVEQLSATAQSIKETALVVRLGKGSVNINF